MLDYNVRILQGSAAPCVRFGGVFSDGFTANFLLNASKRILTINKYLANIWTKAGRHVFWLMV